MESVVCDRDAVDGVDIERVNAALLLGLKALAVPMRRSETTPDKPFITIV